MAGQRSNNQFMPVIFNKSVNRGGHEDAVTGTAHDAAGTDSDKTSIKTESATHPTSNVPPSHSSGASRLPGPNPAGKKRRVKKKKSAPRKKQKTARKSSFARQLKGNRARDTLDRVFERLRRSRAQVVPEVVDEAKVERDRKSLDQALKIFGEKVEQRVDGLYLVRNMATPIYNYQLVGAGFMVRHERSRGEHVGGIIADDMGMGKTIQAITCMVTRLPSKKDRAARKCATLIVVPNEVIMAQWMEELKKHINPDVINLPLEYTAVGKRLPGHVLQGCDCVLATYRKVLLDHKSNGPLFEVEFHRIILDEGDRIKNASSATSIACGKLKAKSKWVLSATPLQNAVAEITPYLRFLGIDADASRDDFEALFGKLPQDDTKNRLESILSNRMIYRRKGELFLGKPMCLIPPCHHNDTLIDLPKRERLLYECIESRFRTSMKEFKNDGRKTGKYRTFMSKNFALLTRLRQAVDHPFLLETCMTEVLTKEDVIYLKDKLVGVKDEAPGHEAIDTWCKTLSPDDFQDDFHSIAYYDHILNSKEGEGVCMACQDVEDLQTLDCGHSICRPCYDRQAGENIKAAKRHIQCLECNKIVATIRQVSGRKSGLKSETAKYEQYMDSEPFEASDGSAVLKTSSGDYFITPIEGGKWRSPGDDYSGFQPKTRSGWLDECDKKPNEPIAPSAKTTAVMDAVKDSIKTGDDKAIIFVQWGITAKILGRMLNFDKIGFVYYWGDMSSEQKSKNLATFHEVEEVKVMVASLKCGHAGLNITCANHVIDMTPWWNYSVEEQAFGRVYRHGQKKETYFVRIAVRNSIDDRMLDMQDRKESEIAVAMKEGKAVKPLTVDDCIALFGGSDEAAEVVEEGEDSDQSDDSDESDYVDE